MSNSNMNIQTFQTSPESGSLLLVDPAESETNRQMWTVVKSKPSGERKQVGLLYLLAFPESP